MIETGDEQLFYADVRVRSRRMSWRSGSDMLLSAWGL